MWSDLNDVDTSPEALTKLQVDLCKSWDDPWALLECRVKAAKTIAVLQARQSVLPEKVFANNAPRCMGRMDADAWALGWNSCREWILLMKKEIVDNGR